MRLLIRLFLAFVALLIAAVAAVYLVLRAPAPLPLPAPGAVLDGVTLIEPGVRRLDNMRVTVEGKRIVGIEPSSTAAGPYAGMYVLPGLTDMHVHFPPPTLPGQTELFAFLHLYHGVTTLRDAGDVDGQSSEPARRGVAEERFPGPRIFACGPFVDGDPPLWKNSIVVRTADEGRAAVRRVSEHGFNCVKVYHQLGAEALAAIRAEAHALGLPVIGHVPHRVPFEAARLDDAQHLIGVAPPLVDASVRFPQILRAWQLLDEARLQGIVQASLQFKIAHTPTLVTIDRIVAQQDAAAVRREADALLLPRFYRDVIWNPDGGFTAATGLAAADFDMIRAAQRIQLQTVKRLFDAGVHLHTGTDTLIAFVVPGAALHRELRLFVEAGLTPEQALMSSTRVSSRFLGVDGLGELRAEAPAELVVFRDDPTRDLAALDSIVAVVRDGRLYSRASLDEQLARYQQAFDNALYDAVVTPLVRMVLAATKPG